MKATRDQIKTIDRLKRRSDFLAVQGSGRKWVSQSLVLQVRENGLDICRFGLTVSKKTDKSAVIRNRIRRRLRAASRDILPLYAKPGHDYVLVGRAVARDKTYDALKNDLLWCLKRMQLRQDQPEAGKEGSP